VEARLKGAGMHWARASVNPLVALRNAICNDRRAAAWAASVAQIRQQGKILLAVQAKQAAASAAPQPAPSDTGTPAASTTSSSPKVLAEHPWQRTNYATKARLAQADIHART